MQQEYKEAMEKISLSDSDKKRILANVKKACEESEEKVISMDEFKKRPRFSARQKGMAGDAAQKTLKVLLPLQLLYQKDFLEAN